MRKDIIYKKLAVSFSFLHPSVLLGTWFGSGLLPKAPGTFGSLFALPFYFLFYGFLNLTRPLYQSVFCLGLFLIGWGAAYFLLKKQTITSLNIKEAADPSAIVIDEVVGMGVALWSLEISLYGWGFAFIAFRFFDILKPWPIGWVDRLCKASQKKYVQSFGIMIDDVLAGFYAAFVVYIALRIFGW